MADTLKDEITIDPLGKVYVGMTDQQLADSLNAKTRSRNRSSMSASEVMNQIDVAEFNALTTVNERKIWDVLHIGEINPFGVEATIFSNVFGGGSSTISNLQTARVQSISRAEELGFGFIPVGEVTNARSQT